jgi:hypothetical protein
MSFLSLARLFGAARCPTLYTAAVAAGEGTGTAPASLTGQGRATGIDAVPQDENRANDIRLITPLLVMGLIVVCGLLYFAYLGHA